HMVAPVCDVTYGSADDFIRHLLFEQETVHDGDSIRYVYRGERSAHPEFRLLPALLRSGKKSHHTLYNDSIGMTEQSGQLFLLNEFKALYRFYVTANKNGFLLPEVDVFRQFEIHPRFD